MDDPCGLCSGGTSPPEHPCPSTLVSVASLGVDGWVVAEELARVLGAERVAWHASSAGSLLALAVRGGAESPGVFAGFEEWMLVETAKSFPSLKFRAPWPEECPLASEKYRRIWPALRALAGLGVRVVGDAGGLVTLAVEVP